MRLGWLFEITRSDERSVRGKLRDRRNLAARQARIEERLSQEDKSDRGRVFSGGNERHEVSGRATATAVGGIGLIHRMVRAIGLAGEIDKALSMLKIHCPYHESDHVLNMAYNILCGGRTLDDLDLLRHDEAFLNAVKARRIPDPTTAGDFLRRFVTFDDTDRLAEAINTVRVRLWKMQRKAFRELAFIDIDGTIASTLGEKKEGCDLSYKGDFGYAPLVVSMANTKEVLYVHNGPENRPSHEDAFEFLAPAVEWAKEVGFKKVRLRGDTDFSLTEYLDHWTDQDVGFVFGVDAYQKLVDLAKWVKEADWRLLERPVRPTADAHRERRENVKERVVRERGFRTLHLEEEHWNEFDYRPLMCERAYRVVARRKTIIVTEGQGLLLPETRFFFYITNIDKGELSAPEIVFQANARCDQENIIEQLKNGVAALRMRSHTLVSNSAYILIATLAWNLKARLSLYDHRAPESAETRTMEFRRFVNSFIRLPCQVVRAGRRIVLRLLSWSPKTTYVTEAHERFRLAMRA